MNQETADDLFNKIYDSTYRRCLSYVGGKCGNPGDIADILQETYLDLYRSIVKRGTDYLENPEAFVIRIAKTKLYKHYSLKEKLKSFIPLFERNPEEEDTLLSCQAEVFFNEIEENYVNQEVLKQIWDYVETKPRDVQKAFYLFYRMEMTIPQIAEALQINESTVKNRIYRTVREIHAKFRGGDVTEWKTQ